MVKYVMYWNVNMVILTACMGGIYMFEQEFVFSFLFPGKKLTVLALQTTLIQSKTINGWVYCACSVLKMLKILYRSNWMIVKLHCLEWATL